MPEQVLSEMIKNPGGGSNSPGRDAAVLGAFPQRQVGDSRVRLIWESRVGRAAWFRRGLYKQLKYSSDLEWCGRTSDSKFRFEI